MIDLWFHSIENYFESRSWVNVCGNQMVFKVAYMVLSLELNNDFLWWKSFIFTVLSYYKPSVKIIADGSYIKLIVKPLVKNIDYGGDMGPGILTTQKKVRPLG